MPLTCIYIHAFSTVSVNFQCNFHQQSSSSNTNAGAQWQKFGNYFGLIASMKETYTTVSCKPAICISLNVPDIEINQCPTNEKKENKRTLNTCTLEAEKMRYFK